jgi:hypothetical protein
MALGLVVTAMGFTGIYAVFTDRATTGTNSGESGAQARIADLKIATSEFQSCTGETYTDDLESGVISVADLQPGGGSFFSNVCLRNDGTATLDLTMTAIDVVDTETGCTGDEDAAGDATCGTAGIGDGDLGPALLVVFSRIDCSTADSQISGNTVLATLAAGAPESLGSLDAGDTACLSLRVQMLTAGQQGVPLEGIQQAQSDKVEWRFAFDGTQA